MSQPPYRELRVALVHQLGPALGQHHVRRLQITMRDSPLMGLGERISNLRGKTHCLFRRQCMGRGFAEASVFVLFRMPPRRQ
jgi:hypothetical protein